VRENSLSLIDAFGVPDEILRNPLIARDGTGYAQYIEAMRNNRFNKDQKVAPYWNKIIKPLQKPENYEK
jgi:hypothetical protein